MAPKGSKSAAFYHAKTLNQAVVPRVRFFLKPGIPNMFFFQTPRTISMIPYDTSKCQCQFVWSICGKDGTVGTVGTVTGRERRLFKSMACSYVIAAAGPAQPDVRAEPFNGATCLWERNEGVGENYQALTS